MKGELAPRASSNNSGGRAARRPIVQTRAYVHACMAGRRSHKGAKSKHANVPFPRLSRKRLDHPLFSPRFCLIILLILLRFPFFTFFVLHTQRTRISEPRSLGLFFAFLALFFHTASYDSTEFSRVLAEITCSPLYFRPVSFLFSLLITL